MHRRSFSSQKVAFENYAPLQQSTPGFATLKSLQKDRHSQQTTLKDRIKLEEEGGAGLSVHCDTADLLLPPHRLGKLADPDVLFFM
jgi:hypothetical protein